MKRIFRIQCPYHRAWSCEDLLEEFEYQLQSYRSFRKDWSNWEIIHAVIRRPMGGLTAITWKEHTAEEWQKLKPIDLSWLKTGSTQIDVYVEVTYE